MVAPGVVIDSWVELLSYYLRSRQAPTNVRNYWNVIAAIFSPYSQAVVMKMQIIRQHPQNVLYENRELQKTAAVRECFILYSKLKLGFTPWS